MGATKENEAFMLEPRIHEGLGRGGRSPHCWAAKAHLGADSRNDTGSLRPGVRVPVVTWALIQADGKIQGRESWPGLALA